jgi:hypothetical protein
MKYDIATLDQEFSTQLLNSGEFRDDQRNMVDYYNKNVYYQPRPGEVRPKRNVGANLLKAFGKKNAHYISPFPTIRKLSDGPDVQSRQIASLVEKIIVGVWRENKGALRQRKWALDGTLMAEPAALTEFDIKKRKVVIKRLDPRYCHTRFANGVDEQVVAFWYAVPMTKEAIKAKWNVEPKKLASTIMALDGNVIPIDGVERFYVIMRWDATTKAAWVGDTFLEQPHKHNMPGIPIDVAKPIETGMDDGRGGFFLKDLVPLQAEFNETLRRKSNIIRKLSNPAVWGKGVIANQLDEIKKALEGSGGFVGLKANGELGFLQLQETKVLDEHMVDLYAKMKDISGFGDASFGQALGANTSGSAVGMYFAPTQKAIEDQWIAFQAFYESINEKIIYCYQNFGLPGEQFKIYGKRPKGSIEMVEDGADDEGNPQYKQSYQSGGYVAQFTTEQLEGVDGCTEIIPQSPTPKDDVAVKTTTINAKNAGLISTVTAMEDYGILDPENEIALLAAEREDPRLHPEVFQNIAQAVATAMGGQSGAPAGTPPLPNDLATAAGAGVGNVQ